MKALHWILIGIIVLLVAAGGVYIWREKKKKGGNTQTLPDAKAKETKAKAQASDAVRNLQLRVNSLLPESYPKLVVDGIYGPKTEAALQYVNNMKQAGTLPSKAQATDEKGAMITIDTAAVWDNVKSIGKFLVNETPIEYTGIGVLSKLF